MFKYGVSWLLCLGFSRVYSLNCYICSPSDSFTGPDGDCQSTHQFHYECTAESLNLPAGVRLLCKSTRVRVAKDQYAVSKECVTEQEYFREFPHVTHTCQDVTENVSMCICDTDLCNGKPLSQQLQTLNKSIGELFQQTPVFLNFDSQQQLSIAPGPTQLSYAQTHNSAVGYNQYPQQYQNPLPDQLAYGPPHLFDPQSLYDGNGTNSEGLVLAQGGLGGFLGGPQQQFQPGAQTASNQGGLAQPQLPQPPSPPLADPRFTAHGDASFTGGSPQITGETFLPPQQFLNGNSASPPLQQNVAPNSIPLPASTNAAIPRLHCIACGSAELAPGQDCAGPQIQPCDITEQLGLQLEAQGIEYVEFQCLSRRTQLDNGYFAVEKGCVSSFELEIEYGTAFNGSSGCFAAADGRVVLCLCAYDNCNTASVDTTVATQKAISQTQQPSQTTGQATLSTQPFHRPITVPSTQTTPQITDLLLSNEVSPQSTAHTDVTANINAHTANLGHVTCLSCATSQMSVATECTQQYEQDCSQIYHQNASVFCLTQAAKAANGLISMEKRCVSQEDHIAAFPGIQVNLEGCGEGWKGYVQYCVCRSKNCNEASLWLQQSHANFSPSISLNDSQVVLPEESGGLGGTTPEATIKLGGLEISRSQSEPIAKAEPRPTTGVTQPVDVQYTETPFWRKYANSSNGRQFANIPFYAHALIVCLYLTLLL